MCPRSPSASPRPSPSEIRPSTVSLIPTGRRTQRSTTERTPTTYRRTHQRSGFSQCQHVHDAAETLNLEPELCLLQVTSSKVPTSILKRPSSIYGTDVEPAHRRRGERRVRFRDPETTVHGESTACPVRHNNYICRGENNKNVVCR